MFQVSQNFTYLFTKNLLPLVQLSYCCAKFLAMVYYYSLPKIAKFYQTIFSKIEKLFYFFLYFQREFMIRNNWEGCRIWKDVCKKALILLAPIYLYITLIALAFVFFFFCFKWSPRQILHSLGFQGQKPYTYYNRLRKKYVLYNQVD